MARRLGEPFFDKPERRIIPPARLEVIRNGLCEIDHDSNYGTIDRRTDDHWIHRVKFGIDCGIGDAPTLQPRFDD